MLKQSERVRITADPQYLRYGLFGNVLLFVFRLLPYLESRNVFPQWAIGAELYGADPDRIVIPGLFDLAYRPPDSVDRIVSLEELYKWRQSYLGADFHALSKLWNRYFKIPERINSAVEDVGDLSETLGVHYRGNEKLTSSWDSNNISQADYLEVVADFLAGRDDIKSLLVATDDAQFRDRVAEKLKLPIITRDPGRFLFDNRTSSDRALEADKALVDCVLLSRCKAVMSTSSALPSFAKVFEPGLEIYRCAASKLFEDSPYWPVAYIPVYKAKGAAAKDVIARAMTDDWTFSPQYRKFKDAFAHRPRTAIAHISHRLQGKLGLLPVQIFMRKQA